MVIEICKLGRELNAIVVSLYGLSVFAQFGEGIALI